MLLLDNIWKIADDHRYCKILFFSHFVVFRVFCCHIKNVGFILSGSTIRKER